MDRMVGKANRSLGMLKITFESRGTRAMKRSIRFSGKATLEVCSSIVESAFARRH